VNVLIDTSVWVRHFRSSNTDVVRLLDRERVVSHDFVVGELACGSLKARQVTIGYLQELISLPVMSVSEVLILIESKELYSRGIGLIDAQLLASTLATPDTMLWTVDKRLGQIATELEVSYIAG
jgi:predicted nucleic acid-binding protein